MENKGGKNEPLSGAPEQVEQGYFGAVEKLPPKLEMPKIETEQSPEQPETAPILPETPELTPEQDVVKNTLPDIERNAEHIPKEYMKEIDRIIDEYAKKPHEQAEMANLARGDLLQKMFDRKRSKTA